jgi:hypothetical protein
MLRRHDAVNAEKPFSLLPWRRGDPALQLFAGGANPNP